MLSKTKLSITVHVRKWYFCFQMNSDCYIILLKNNMHSQVKALLLVLKICKKEICCQKINTVHDMILNYYFMLYCAYSCAYLKRADWTVFNERSRISCFIVFLLKQINEAFYLFV